MILYIVPSTPGKEENVYVCMLCVSPVFTILYYTRVRVSWMAFHKIPSKPNMKRYFWLNCNSFIIVEAPSAVESMHVSQSASQPVTQFAGQSVSQSVSLLTASQLASPPAHRLVSHYYSQHTISKMSPLHIHTTYILPMHSNQWRTKQQEAYKYRSELLYIHSTRPTAHY